MVTQPSDMVSSATTIQHCSGLAVGTIGLNGHIIGSPVVSLHTVEDTSVVNRLPSCHLKKAQPRFSPAAVKWDALSSLKEGEGVGRQEVTCGDRSWASFGLN